MTLETAMASRVAIAPPKIVTQSLQNGLSFVSSKPLSRTTPPQNCLLLKLRSLTIQSNSLPTTSWSFPINTEVKNASKAELSKLTLRAARASSSDANGGKNSKKLGKPNRPKISIKERNPKRLSSSASERVVLDYIQIIKYPLVTDLAMREMINNNTLTFMVDNHAGKENIKDAAKKMFKIETRKVNTLVMPDGSKKAYLMLKPNHNALETAKKFKII